MARHMDETMQNAMRHGALSTAHDVNPTTAASTRDLVGVEKYDENDEDNLDEDDEEEQEEEEEEEKEEDEDIPYSVLKPLPVPRRVRSAPLPDLRFEQSYLSSIAGANTWWNVVLITMRDQGSLWSLVVLGWGHWNRSAQLSGSTLGARARRWWYRTNNWDIPRKLRNFGDNAELAASVGDVSARWNGGEFWNFAD